MEILKDLIILNVSVLDKFVHSVSICTKHFTYKKYYEETLEKFYAGKHKFYVGTKKITPQTVFNVIAW